MSNCVFNFNILALVLFGILGGSQIYIRGPCAPRRPPSVKILKRAQVLAYIYIIVNFQLRSSIHARLTERSLYNSVLGPRLFIMYSADLADKAAEHDINFHDYADDTQLYVHCLRNDL